MKQRISRNDAVHPRGGLSMSRKFRWSAILLLAVGLQLACLYGVQRQRAEGADKGQEPTSLGTDVCMVCHIDFASRWARVSHSQKMLSDAAVPKPLRGEAARAVMVAEASMSWAIVNVLSDGRVFPHPERTILASNAIRERSRRNNGRLPRTHRAARPVMGVTRSTLPRSLTPCCDRIRTSFV